jgi:hypothetical protein
MQDVPLRCIGVLSSKPWPLLCLTLVQVLFRPQFAMPCCSLVARGAIT